MGKKKTTKKNGIKKNDDDFDDMLSEFTNVNMNQSNNSSSSTLDEKNKVFLETEDNIINAPIVVDIVSSDATKCMSANIETASKLTQAEAFLAQMTGDTGGNTVTNAKAKKKKKGKKPASSEHGQNTGTNNSGTNVVSKTAPKSKAAKAILERQAAQKIQDDALAAEIAEMEAIEQAKNDAIEEEERQKLEVLTKKKDAKKARVEKQKKEGTYMTKTEKAKAAKAKAALEAMQEAGMIVQAVETKDHESTNEQTDGKEKKNVSYASKHKKKNNRRHTPPVIDVVEEIVEEKEVVVAVPEIVEALDDWDDDDWESGEVLTAFESIVNAADEKDDNEEEDLLVLETRKEKERLRLQGLEIQKREADARAAAEENESSSDSDSDSSDSETEVYKKKPCKNNHKKSKAQLELESRKRIAADRRKTREAEARAAVSMENLRSPICCIMGHVDTGKTKLLDNIRQTNVQDGEAGGITQQIGATFFPIEALKTKTLALAKKSNLQYKLPGLLVIDTPGHESFTNLRSRGSSLCDIAILVVDIMHGLEPQTLESLRLLKSKRAPFIVALNKIDRLYSWKTCVNMPIQEALLLQNKSVIREFNDRVTKMKVEFAEQSLNAELYWENTEVGRTISFVPTSAITGEGVADMLMLLVKLTQERLTKSLAFVDILQCTVLEVKVMEGLGTTVDTILVNGSLSEGDTIVVCTLDGPVTTTIRSLLTPHPMKEIRVKGEFIHHPTIKAAMGVKICAQGLEKAVAGTTVYVLGPDDDEEELKEAVMSDLTNVMNSVNTTKRGVVVQASTLGALEALLEFLKNGCDPPIPVSGVNLGPVHKKDVIRASVQLEHSVEYATILAFDVKVNPDALNESASLGVKIFTADIIYHLFDQFNSYMDGIKAERREKFGDVAVFPCILKILPTCIFNKKDPLILGVDIEDGILKIGTPLVLGSGSDHKAIGKVVSIEKDHKEVDLAKRGSSVAVRIQNESNVAYGRHFDHTVKLVSKLTRESIDSLKENFKDDLNKEDWMCVIKLKKMFDII